MRKRARENSLALFICYYDNFLFLPYSNIPVSKSCRTGLLLMPKEAKAPGGQIPPGPPKLPRLRLGTVTTYCRKERNINLSLRCVSGRLLILSSGKRFSSLLTIQKGPPPEALVTDIFEECKYRQIKKSCQAPRFVLVRKRQRPYWKGVVFRCAGRYLWRGQALFLPRAF